LLTSTVVRQVILANAALVNRFLDHLAKKTYDGTTPFRAFLKPFETIVGQINRLDPHFDNETFRLYLEMSLRDANPAPKQGLDGNPYVGPETWLCEMSPARVDTCEKLRAALDAKYNQYVLATRPSYGRGLIFERQDGIGRDRAITVNLDASGEKNVLKTEISDLLLQIINELLHTSTELARAVQQASPTFARHARLIKCEDVPADTKEISDLHSKESQHHHQSASIKEREYKVTQQNQSDASKDPGEHVGFFVPHFVIERGPSAVKRGAEEAASRGSRRIQ
jgi:hypothetical protein